MHEVAIASLRGEFQRQSSELKLAEEEVSRLRKSLAKKVSFIKPARIQVEIIFFFIITGAATIFVVRRTFKVTKLCQI